MSNPYDKYIKRLKQKGENIGDVYKGNTITFINKNFKDSPTYRLLTVKSTEFPNITEMDARVIEVDRSGELREVLFRPNESLNVGTYVGFDNETWLIFDKYGGEQSVTVKVVVANCNRVLKWKDKNGLIVEIDCVTSATDLGSKAKQSRNEITYNKYDVKLPSGQIYAFVELNDKTKEINYNDRFIFGKNVYEVVGFDDMTLVDKNGYGIIQFILKIATKQYDDDFENHLGGNIRNSKNNETVGQNETGEQGVELW